MEHFCFQCDLNLDYQTESILTVRGPRVVEGKEKPKKNIKREDLIWKAEDLTFLFDNEQKLLCVTHVKNNNNNNGMTIRGAGVRPDKCLKRIGDEKQSVIYRNVLVKVFGEDLADIIITLEEEKRKHYKTCYQRFVICDLCYSKFGDEKNL